MPQFAPSGSASSGLACGRACPARRSAPAPEPARRLLAGLSVLLLVLALAPILRPAPLLAAERAKLRAFLEITGFDKAIEGLQESAVAGPGLAGNAPDAFGSEWVRLAREIFDKQAMVEQALDMMEAVMPDDLVNHGAAFYASDLGQRLVAAENAAILTPDEEKYALGELLVMRMLQSDPQRIELFRKMSDAIGGVEQSVRSVIELQVRYLMAAMVAGSGDIDMSEADLRGLLESQAEEIARNVEAYTILGAAYTYRDFSNADLAAYVQALEHPKMRRVYELLNAIQFEVMAARYERLAAALAELAPQTEL